MKKNVLKTTALALVLMMGFAGCGGSDSSSSASDSSSASSESESAGSETLENVTLTYATGGTTGTYYTVGSTMATVLNDAMPNVSLNAISAGASKSNILDIEDDMADIAIVQNDVMSYAYSGTDLFAEDGEFKKFTTIAGVYDETCQIIADSSIESIADLKGKAVNVGDAGSGVEFNATQILAAYGIDINTDITKVNGSFSDSANSIKDGKIQAAFITAGAPTTAIVDLAISKDVKLLEIDEEHATALMAEYPFYTQSVIPGGTYSGIDTDTNTLSVRATLIASEDVPDYAITQLLEAMFDNQSTLAASNAKFEELNLEDAVKGVSVPFHPGAEAYFTEAGVLN
ncbi:MAG: TAXI family TRAP transporter solute-binding subunit [Bacillota bacterium]